MRAEPADVVVIGAGVVGLAIAAALAQRGREVLVLERNDHIGEETSSRNSEVIHAGIYYPTGSLKARLCVRGKSLLYDYCGTHGVGFRRCGKLIVASRASQQETLRDYQRQALTNGAGKLEWLDAPQIERLEPAVQAVAGLLSPTTGIVDSHGFMLALQADLEAHGGLLVCRAPVAAIAEHGDRFRVTTSDYALAPQLLVNAAGLHAPSIAAAVCDAPPTFYARGRYYTYSDKAPFQRLVYPIASAGGLGVHVTLDLAGQARFGPDVEWIGSIDYTFSDVHRAAFIDAIRQYYPSLDAERLQPGYTGIRPKISGPGEPAADFRIEFLGSSAQPALVNLFGIESPGLTAALAIAEHVCERVDA